MEAEVNQFCFQFTLFYVNVRQVCMSLRTFTSGLCHSYDGRTIALRRSRAQLEDVYTEGTISVPMMVGTMWATNYAARMSLGTHSREYRTAWGTLFGEYLWVCTYMSVCYYACMMLGTPSFKNGKGEARWRHLIPPSEHVCVACHPGESDLSIF